MGNLGGYRGDRCASCIRLEEEIAGLKRQLTEKEEEIRKLQTELFDMKEEKEWG